VKLPRELMQSTEFIDSYQSCRLVREGLASHLENLIQKLVVESEHPKLLLQHNLNESLLSNLAERRAYRNLMTLLLGDGPLNKTEEDNDGYR